MNGPPSTRVLLLVALSFAAPGAGACSVTISDARYMSVVALQGPKIEGLKWIRVYNILDYEGTGRIVVSGLRGKERFPIARWENGMECGYDDQGTETCGPNQPGAGVNVSVFLPSGMDASDDRNELRKGALRLIVESNGREFEMTLRSRIVRTTPELRAEWLEYGSAILCP